MWVFREREQGEKALRQELPSKFQGTVRRPEWLDEVKR